jgi:hypothetical protein
MLSTEPRPDTDLEASVTVEPSRPELRPMPFGPDIYTWLLDR